MINLFYYKHCLLCELTSPGCCEKFFETFSKANACAQPPHRYYGCAIEVFADTNPQMLLSVKANKHWKQSNESVH